MQDIYITDLIDVSVLQRIQDGFSAMTGMAALTTDSEGKPITKGSNFTDYCMVHIRKCDLGREGCEKCDKYGAEKTRETGHSTTYICHSGLVDFSAPIIADNHLIGCFIGGQVLYEKPDKNRIEFVANHYGLDPDLLWEEINKIPVIPKKEIDKAAEFLYMVAEVLSNMAYGKYMAKRANQEIKDAADTKSNFLANMSHEIRTPMNAVIGMAEMALRENDVDAMKQYIVQIKNSGRALLNIINDILDFSKIEAGKMDIIPVEYESLSVFNDVANILMTKIADKDLELFVEANPNIPYMMYGDNLRFRQILINLANNAIKFTKKGFVKIKVDYEKIDEENVCLLVDVIDTGIGIKPEDINKLFASFSQVDSKRNRNEEGTGLGLSICQSLLEIMGGEISVSSEYEKGSVFSFKLPQKVVDWRKSLEVQNTNELIAIGYFSNHKVARQFYDDLDALSVFSIALTDRGEFDDMLENYREEIKGKKLYFFFEQKDYGSHIKQILDVNQDVMGIMISDYFSEEKPEHHNMRIYKKPFTTVSVCMALNNEEILFSDTEDTSADMNFTAPDAKVLIVDDNSINLTVAEGLLEPLKMQITTATSGKTAIELLENQMFDLIFMDHMMPELDGVETTRIIRRLHPEYAEVPIIALTANAIAGMKEKFLAEGMNDFVAKPIEVKTIVSKVKQWLPVHKIKDGKVISSHNTEALISEEKYVIGDLDTDNARKLLGSDKLFWSILKEYYRTIPSKTESIRNFYISKDWPAYTIEVHALKSTSRQIGAQELAIMAAELEKAGNSRDTILIDNYTEPMLEKYAEYQEILRPFCEEAESDNADKAEVDYNRLKELFDDMLNALDNLDMDLMEEVVNEMGIFKYPEAQADLYEKLKVAAANIDVDECDMIISSWKELC